MNSKTMVSSGHVHLVAMHYSESVSSLPQNTQCLGNLRRTCHARHSRAAQADLMQRRCDIAAQIMRP